MCWAARKRTIQGKSAPVMELSRQEMRHLLPLAEDGFMFEEIVDALVVDGQSRVKVKGNWYSAPVSAGCRVMAVVWPSQIVISYGGRQVARHERCYQRGQQILNLEHYLDVLERKPGAMSGSTPLQQWRQAGRWPACLDRIWAQLEGRHGKSNGTRAMITQEVESGTIRRDPAGVRAIDGRTTRQEGYAISQKKRKRVEEIFGWMKTVGGMRKLRHRGLHVVGWMFTFAAAAYNLVRMRNLTAKPVGVA
jgi:hypothetical protein